MRDGILYIGSFTPPGGEGRGVTVVRRRDDTELEVVREVAAESPGFLALHPALPRLYVAHGVDPGYLTTYAVGDGGALTAVATHSTGGANPCHVAVDAGGGAVAVANYRDGSAAVHRLGADGVPQDPPHLLTHDGSGPHPDRQDGPHAHFARYEAGVLHVVDLGTDRVHRYLTGDDGRTVPHPDGPAVLRAGSGPRHLVTDGRGTWVVADELGGSVTAYAQRDDGRWDETSTAPASTAQGQNYPSHIELTADGLVYVANRGPDTIGVLRLEDGRLTPVGEVDTGGSWPRHFALAGDRLYVANEHSHDVTVLSVADGIPTPTGERLATPSPGCVLPTR